MGTFEHMRNCFVTACVQLCTVPVPGASLRIMFPIPLKLAEARARSFGKNDVLAYYLEREAQQAYYNATNAQQSTGLSLSLCR